LAGSECFEIHAGRDAGYRRAVPLSWTVVAFFGAISPIGA